MYLFHHPYIKMINRSAVDVHLSQLSEVDSILQVFDDFMLSILTNFPNTLTIIHTCITAIHGLCKGSPQIHEKKSCCLLFISTMHSYTAYAILFITSELMCLNCNIFINLKMVWRLRQIRRYFEDHDYQNGLADFRCKNA